MRLRLVKRILILSAVFVLVFTFSSCDRIKGLLNFPSGESPSPSAPVVYYNGAYGIQVTVPDGWFAETVNAANMTATPEESGDESKLELIPYEDSGSEVQLIELWNREKSEDKEHASLMMYVELYDGVDEETYLDAFKESYAGDFDGYYSTFELRDEATIGGKAFTLLKFNTKLPDSDDTYYEEYYIRQIEEGKFLIVMTTYWADNQVSQDAAASILNCFTVSK
jgi:hypothetical protein